MESIFDDTTNESGLPFNSIHPSHVERQFELTRPLTEEHEAFKSLTPLEQAIKLRDLTNKYLVDQGIVPPPGSNMLNQSNLKYPDSYNADEVIMIEHIEEESPFDL
jgi:hypothetical protein